LATSTGFLHAGSLKYEEPLVRVFVARGIQMGLARFAQASTTMTRLLAPVMVNPT